MRRRRCAELLAAKTLQGLPPGCHADGRGLYLLVTATGSRRWIIRTKIKGGKRRELGLGSLHDVAIDEARAKASEMRRSARQGCDPTIERRVRAAKAVPFRQAFESYFDNKRQSLGNAKHLAQWVATMEAYVFPRIGDRPVAEIRSGEVIEVLAPIWHLKPETARRVLQRMNAVFEAAILRNWRERASPCIGVVQALGGTRHRVVQHHRALSYEEVPAFIRVLRACAARPVTKLAFEWLVVTATRSGETRGAAWSEIDEGRSEWVIPGEGSADRWLEAGTTVHARCSAQWMGPTYAPPGRCLAQRGEQVVANLLVGVRRLSPASRGARMAGRSAAQQVVGLQHWTNRFPTLRHTRSQPQTDCRHP